MRFMSQMSSCVGIFFGAAATPDTSIPANKNNASVAPRRGYLRRRFMAHTVSQLALLFILAALVRQGETRHCEDNQEAAGAGIRRQVNRERGCAYLSVLNRAGAALLEHMVLTCKPNA